MESQIMIKRKPDEKKGNLKQFLDDIDFDNMSDFYKRKVRGLFSYQKIKLKDEWISLISGILDIFNPIINLIQTYKEDRKLNKLHDYYEKEWREDKKDIFYMCIGNQCIGKGYTSQLGKF